MKFFSVVSTTYLFILLIAAGGVYGQTGESPKLILHVSPRNAILILDTAHIRQGGLLDVSPGTHVIKSWAPKRELVIDTFQVDSGHFFIYTKNLHFTNSYLKYRSNIRKERSKALIPLIATGAVVAFADLKHGNLSSKLDDNLGRAKWAKSSYDLAITQEQLDYYQGLYNDYRDKYDHFRRVNNTIVIAATILSVAGIATTVYILARKHTPYTEQPLLSRVNAGFLLEGNSSVAASMTFKF